MKESRVRTTRIKITPTTRGVKREENHFSHLNSPMSMRKRPPKIIPPSIAGSPPCGARTMKVTKMAEEGPSNTGYWWPSRLWSIVMRPVTISRRCEKLIWAAGSSPKATPQRVEKKTTPGMDVMTH